jgi:predicted ATPase/class 3 adenylate cyclase
MVAQPSGTVTMLFSDIEGSTRLLQRLGRDQYADALELHRRLLREAFARHHGFEVDCEGDAFFVAFPTAGGAIAAAAEAARALGAVEWPEECEVRVRIGLDTGEPLLAPPKYVGLEVHRAARIMAAGHGGQVLLSQTTRDLLDPGVALRDLGEHRLKDLSAPERIYQLGSDDFPPLRSLHQTNLPIPSTPFLGRVRELSDVLGLLSREDVRLLTLTGPGGTGKTRLAAQAAAELATRYPDGVWWVPLGQLRDPELVLVAAGQALDAKNGLAEHIGDRSLLLSFDNFEHVVEAAAGVAGLLTTCPRLELLVTSRQPLHVTGEQEYPVPPLLHEEGIGFFLARARAVQPDFHAEDAISEICHRLDDLPLALELAAARVKALSSQQILERLDERLPLLTGGARDAPRRQRTLRATIEWSYDLLSAREQRLFGGLSVFRGGCTLDAAEEVVDADLDTLQSLVDKSLLRQSAGRFWMLETIGEYAGERLDDSGTAEEHQQRHAEHFLALAEEAEPNLRWSGTKPGEWLDRLEREQDNLRAALDRLEAAGERELVLRLAGALSRFWVMRGHLAEGRGRLEGALRADPSPTAARAKALNGAAVLALGVDVGAARRHTEEAVALHRSLGDRWGAAYAGFLLGQALGIEGDYAAAQLVFDESLQGFRDLGDEHYVLLATDGLAGVFDELGDFERARPLHEENLRRAREQSNRRIVALSLDQLASYARDEGRVEDALSMLKESLEILRDLDDRLGIAENLGRFGRVLAVAGRPEEAARILASSEALYEETGTGVLSWVAKMNDETLNAIRTQLDDSTFAEAWEKGQSFTLDEAVTLALEC